VLLANKVYWRAQSLFLGSLIEEKILSELRWSGRIVFNAKPLSSYLGNSENSGNLHMSHRPNLLISLEEIMLKSFPILRDSDTLSSAFAVFLLRDLEEIVVLDENDNFLGIAKAALLYSKMPPSILNMPLDLSVRSKNTDRLSADSILDVGRKRVHEDLDLDSLNHFSQITEPLGSLLSKVSSLHNYYFGSRIIPVFGQPNLVQGIITHREILRYLEQDPILKEATVADLYLNNCLKEYVSILSHDDCLAVAAMLIEYTLVDCIAIISNSNKLIGILSKTWISQLIHQNHLDIIDLPLKNFVKVLDTTPKLVTMEEPLSNVINHLIKSNTKILTSSASQSKSLDLFTITPLTIINFFLSSF